MANNSTDAILWRRLDHPGHEISRLESRDKQWELSGTAIFYYEEDPCKLDYLVICDSDWRTTSAQIKGTIGDRKINMDILVDKKRWRLNGEEHRTVEGCIDIDLGFSPSTNLLPIRRLSLAVGEEAEVKAAWLPFPSLEFEPLQQLYRREDENSYKYESGGGRFKRLLKVNSTGLVTDYPGIWQEELKL